MKSLSKIIWFSTLLLLLTNGCVSQSNPSVTQSLPEATLPLPTPTNAPLPKPSETILPTEEHTSSLFDDFNYSAQDEMTANGWIIRAQAGWPGVPGATFLPENVSFVDDTQVPTNRLLRMTSSTDGTSANTFQTQICHQRKYLEGTYAMAIRLLKRSMPSLHTKRH